MASVPPNAQRLIAALMTDGPTYRADLARSLDVTRATATNLVNQLLAEGLVVEETTGRATLKNRVCAAPKLGILASLTFYVDACSVHLGTVDGRVFKSLTLPFGDGASATERLDLGIGGLREALAASDLAPDNLLAIHLAVDTQADSRTGEVYQTAASRRWADVNPKRIIEDAFDCPVYVENTQRLRALAEYSWGAGKDHSNIYYVHIEWGITAGHVVDGVIQSGHHGGAGELGHAIYTWDGPLCPCGNSGCLMQYSAIPALLRDATTAAEHPITFDEFRALTESGDATATALVDRAADVLGRTLVTVCHLIDPELIILGGSVPTLSADFASRVADVLSTRALPLIGRNVAVATAELAGSGATGRAGIESLRILDDVIARAVEI